MLGFVCVGFILLSLFAYHALRLRWIRIFEGLSRSQYAQGWLLSCRILLVLLFIA
jgi:hypothetical protein